MCKSEEEDNYHFLLRCKALRPEIDLIFCSKLFSLIETKATIEADVIINLIRNLHDRNKVLLLTSGLKLPALYKCIYIRFIMVSVHKPVRSRERFSARGVIVPLSRFMQLHAGL